MKIQLSTYFNFSKESILDLLHNFDKKGYSFFKGPRNEIKVLKKDDHTLNIKAFKRPNKFNKYIYVHFRKSKAERSFNYACKLLSQGIGTPKPVAFAEEVRGGALERSFYISEHLDYDFTLRDVDLTKEGHEEILRAFTRFTLFLHESNVEFLDHSPGNTLIKLNDGNYEFYLVDLNRMNFKKLNFSKRMKNFARLSQDKEVFKIMANEYAIHFEKSEAEVFDRIWYYNRSFFEKRSRKRQIKKKFKKSIGIK